MKTGDPGQRAWRYGNRRWAGCSVSPTKQLNMLGTGRPSLCKARSGDGAIKVLQDRSAPPMPAGKNLVSASRLRLTCCLPLHGSLRRQDRGPSALQQPCCRPRALLGTCALRFIRARGSPSVDRLRSVCELTRVKPECPGEARRKVVRRCTTASSIAGLRRHPTSHRYASAR